MYLSTSHSVYVYIYGVYVPDRSGQPSCPYAMPSADLLGAGCNSCVIVMADISLTLCVWEVGYYVK